MPRPTTVRRVPVTARVEPRPPTTSRLATWWVLAIGLLIGLVFAAMTHPLRATFAFGGSCLVAAVLRGEGRATYVTP